MFGKYAVTPYKSLTSKLSLSIILMLAASQAFAQPTAEDLQLTANQGNILTIYLKGTGSNLKYSLTADPQKGTVRNFDENTGVCTYGFEPDTTGDDSFKYKVIDDQNAESDEATVSIHLNSKPVAEASSFTVMAGKTHTGTLQHEDIDKDEVVFKLISTGIKGKAELVDKNTGEFVYSANIDYRGSDEFSFQVSDGNLSSDTAVVSVTVDANPDKPSGSSGCSVVANSGPESIFEWFLAFALMGLLAVRRLKG